MSEEVKKPTNHTQNLGISAEDQAELEQIMAESIAASSSKSRCGLLQEIKMAEKKAKRKNSKREALMKQKNKSFIEPWKQARDQLEKAMQVIENEYSRVAAEVAYSSFKLFLRSKLDELEGQTENPFYFDEVFQSLVKGFGLDSFFGFQLVPDEVTGQELEQYQKFWRSIPTEWAFADLDDEIDEPQELFSPRGSR